ncbi:hypothetical protein NPIL_258051, partial [Nephila pilipes]
DLRGTRAPAQTVPQQVTTTVSETPYEPKDQEAILPVVHSFLVFKMCQLLIFQQLLFHKKVTQHFPTRSLK